MFGSPEQRNIPCMDIRIVHAVTVSSLFCIHSYTLRKFYCCMCTGMHRRYTACTQWKRAQEQNGHAQEHSRHAPPCTAMHRHASPSSQRGPSTVHCSAFQRSSRDYCHLDSSNIVIMSWSHHTLVMFLMVLMVPFASAGASLPPAVSRKPPTVLYCKVGRM